MRSPAHQPRNTATARKAFGEVLAARLKQPGTVRQEFAARARISRPHLYALAQGHKQPTLTVFLSIADAMELHPLQLLRLTLAQMNAASGGGGSPETGG